MARRTLALLLTTTAALAGSAGVSQAAVAAKPPGVLEVCGEGALMDVFVDRGELHKEKRNLPAGECKTFTVPKGKYAITVLGHCENNRDSTLADIAVAPQSRALYQDDYIAGARVVPDSTTTYTVTWTCLGVDGAESDPGSDPPPFA